MTSYERMKAERRAESLKQGVSSRVLKFGLPDTSAKVKFTLDGKEVHFLCIRTNTDNNEVEIYLMEEI